MSYNQLHYPTGNVKVSKFCFGVMRKALLSYSEAPFDFSQWSEVDGRWKKVYRNSR
jgi:hypothetical protein